MKNEFKYFAGSATAGNVAYSALNDTGRPIRLLYGQTILTTDATAANRRAVISIKDADGNVVVDSHAGAVVTASTADQHLEWMQGIYRETTFIAGTLEVPIGLDWVVPPGWSFGVSIDAGVAGDSHASKLMAVIL